MSRHISQRAEPAFETAAGHLTANVPVAAPTARVSEIRRSLTGRRFDTVAEIAICDEGRLVGLLNIEDVLSAPDDQLACDLMDTDPPVVAPAEFADDESGEGASRAAVREQ